MQIVTLAYYSAAKTNEDLEHFDPKQLKDRLRQQLKRCGFKHPVIGGLELDYHEDIGLWIPHFHLLVVNDISPLITLRNKYFKKEKRPTSNNKDNTPISRAMMVQELRHLPKQISYLCKQRWQSICAYRDSVTDKRRTKKFRLKQDEFILSLAVLDSYTFSDLMFAYGVRVNRDEFKVNPSVSEQKPGNTEKLHGMTSLR